MNPLSEADRRELMLWAAGQKYTDRTYRPAKLVQALLAEAAELKRQLAARASENPAPNPVKGKGRKL